MNSTVRRRMQLCILIVAMSFIANSIVSAAIPGTPLNFKATVMQDAKGNSFIRLEWKLNTTGGIPQYFFLYKASGKVTDYNLFSKFTKVVPVTKDSGITYQIDYKYDVTGLQSGDYSFYISATNSEGTSQPTQIESVSIQQSLHVTFTTTPPNTGVVGKEYVYDANATASDSSTFWFMAISLPTGASVDSITGVVRFTPRLEGYNTFIVRVYLLRNPNVYADQQWKVIVQKDTTGQQIWFTTTPDKYGIIGKEFIYHANAKSSSSGDIHFTGMNLPQGATLDTLTGVFRYTANTEGLVSFGMKAYLASDPGISVIQQIAIKFLKDSTGNPTNPCALILGTVRDDVLNLIPSGSVKAIAVDSLGQSAKAQISNGSFLLYVKNGTYILYVTGSGFRSEYYKDTSLIQYAERIVVKCNDTLNVHIDVEKFSARRLSGKVIAGIDSSPQMASIIIKSKDGLHKYSASTDQNGNYSIPLTANTEYIISAYPKNSAFYPQHYNKVNDIALATAVLLDADKSGIDFALTKKPTFNNGITGTVKDSAVNGIAAQVTAYYMSSGKPDKNLSFTTTTDSNGVFEMKSIQPGTYILFITPYTKDFLAGYYKQQAYAIQLWDQATQIIVTDNGIVSGCDVMLQKRTGFTGGAILRGLVSGKPLGILPVGEVPVAGAFIFVSDHSGSIIDYGFSDVNGIYQLTEAAAGNYTMFIDRVGYSVYSSPVSFNYDEKAIVEMPVIVLQPKSATSVKTLSTIPGNFLIDAYPNPASSHINIKINNVSEDLALSVYNALGQKVFSSNVQRSNAPMEISFTTAQLPAGMYYLLVQGLQSTQVNSLLIVR